MSHHALRTDAAGHTWFDLAAVCDPSRLPYTVKVLLENVLRQHHLGAAGTEHVELLAGWDGSQSEAEIPFHPGRVLLHDTTGVPCLVDFAGLRDAVAEHGGDPTRVNPHIPVDLVVDHSLVVEAFGRPDAPAINADVDYGRNTERYRLLRWAEHALDGFRVVPPGSGIMHQINLELLSDVVTLRDGVVFPDTLVGADSHTTMVNGAGILGWGVGGIEAQAAMLGEALSLTVPRVLGVRLTGAPRPGVTSTDIVLTLTQKLRERGVVGWFVEFYGPSLAAVSVATRATIANMSPEFGSTSATFPVDAATIDYLRLTGRDAEHVARVEEYCRAQHMWHDPALDPVFTDTLTFDLTEVEASMAGPTRPHERVSLDQVAPAFTHQLVSDGVPDPAPSTEAVPHGAVAIAAITSCTNTSNPDVMLAAGLLAQAAVARGLRRRPWVKTSLAPGSRTVTDYLSTAGLLGPLGELGFDLVGFGCTTCIGNSGPLIPHVADAVEADGVRVAAVLSGNRNFSGRVHPQVPSAFLASPPLVVAYALAGRVDLDLTSDPLGQDTAGNDVYLADLWPTDAAIAELSGSIDAQTFTTAYASIYDGDLRWQSIGGSQADQFPWDPESDYMRRPPFVDAEVQAPPGTDIVGARALAVLGDFVTTDHLSPSGAITADSPAGRYLADRGVARTDFNSYPSRRGNHEVMARGTLANVRVRNALTPHRTGSATLHLPDQTECSVYDAAQLYAREGVPLILLAGEGYGAGSSRDWGAKGPAILGVRAVIARSFERIHRSNLIGMGIIPLQFADGESADSLGLTGHESFDIVGLAGPGPLPAEVTVRADGTTFSVRVRVDTPTEHRYIREGGILPAMVRRFI